MFATPENRTATRALAAHVKSKASQRTFVYDAGSCGYALYRYLGKKGLTRPVIAELGDLPRGDNPRQLMSYLGLTPSEYSSGTRRRQGGITKAGNTHARRAFVEGAWAHRYPAKVSAHLQRHLEGRPKAARGIAWKAQVRLCKRYRQLTTRGKHANQIVVAIAGEVAAFARAIARTVTLVS